MVSLLNEETSEIGKRYFIGYHAPWLKDGIFAATNFGVKLNDSFYS